VVNDEVLSRFNVSEENRVRIQKVADYNYSFLTNTFNDDLVRAGRPYSVEQVYPVIARFGKCDFTIARMLEEEFKKFVVITLLKPDVPHAPPGAVDMYWHFFILHTEEYQAYCQDIWGSFQGDPKYRHHYPANDVTRPGMLQAYIQTRQLYEDVFGSPSMFERDGAAPVAVWTPTSRTSGDSYSGVIDPATYAAEDAARSAGEFE
jgi:hypothetical protein